MIVLACLRNLEKSRLWVEIVLLGHRHGVRCLLRKELAALDISENMSLLPEAPCIVLMSTFIEAMVRYGTLCTLWYSPKANAQLGYLVSHCHPCHMRHHG
jgi:hypothetical protein